MARNEITIDWKKADDLMMAGCHGTEIAAYFGMHPNTFYRRVEQDLNISFGDYLAQKRAKGDTYIKSKQFEKAIKGDNMMLIWLGKNRLDQSDHRPQDQSVNDKVIGDDLEKAKLKAELAELKRIMSESKTGIEHLPSEQAP
jgi:hypothetical protein